MKNHFKDKNVLVTGGTGLVGSHLVEKLLDLGAKVVVVDIVIKPKSYFETQKLADRCKVLMQDIRDLRKMKDIVRDYKIDHIFHLAAQAIVTEAVLNPHSTLDTNIMGTVNVLEAARESGPIQSVIVASSDKAYGKQSWEAVEDQAMAGDHPYDVSKSAADLIARAYHKTYGLPVVVSRFGNIFGPGDLNFNRIIPGIMEAYINKKPLQLRSDGSFIRDYVYVKDVVDGYLALAEHSDKVAGHAFNFSSGYNYSVLDLVEQVSKILGEKVELEILNNQTNEIPRQKLNTQKSRNMLCWEPKYTLQDSLKVTFKWYKDFFNK